jgi:hypothetical protein
MPEWHKIRIVARKYTRHNLGINVANITALETSSWHPWRLMEGLDESA